MLDPKGFDLWAGRYDADVADSDTSNRYPFAGYRDVLQRVYQTIRAAEYQEILDVGFGTGTLTTRLYADGCRVSGLDFSQAMVDIARRKMPEATLLQHDFTTGLPADWSGRRFDCIVSTYALHHLPDADKPGFLLGLLGFLKPGGRVLIGDVAFADRAALALCRAESGDAWDEQEYYFVADELLPQLTGCTASFARVSYCAGVLTLEPAEAQAPPDGALRVAGVVRESIVDGPGLRFTVFAQGCPHGCPGCHNPATHDFAGGTVQTPAALLAEIRRDPLLSGVTFSGGEPFSQAGAFAELARQVRALGLNVLVYTGWTYEQLCAGAAAHPDWTALLEAADYLVDGPFVQAERDLTLPFRGSRNQRILDMAATREAGRPVVYEER